MGTGCHHARAAPSSEAVAAGSLARGHCTPNGAAARRGTPRCSLARGTTERGRGIGFRRGSGKVEGRLGRGVEGRGVVATEQIRIFFFET